MARPAIAYVLDGHVVRKMPAEWDGTALVEKKRRRKYIVMNPPYLMTEKAGFGSRAVNVFFVTTNTVTSWDVDVMAQWLLDVKKVHPETKKGAPVEVLPTQPAGFTVMAPWWTTDAEIELEGGLKEVYRVTPEHVYEESDSSDLRAWNQQQATSKTMLWLAAGAGAAGMVMLYFLFQLVKGTSFFGHGA